MIRKSILFLSLVCSSAIAPDVHAEVVEKVADLQVLNLDGLGYGPSEPVDRFVQVGTNLWFTSSRGGAYDEGTISRFDLVTREVIEVASMDNDTGRRPDGALLVIGNEGYFTTTSGGTVDRGTIAKINLETGAITTLFSFPQDRSMGATPRGALTRIGDDLWTTTSTGGNDGRGTLVKYNLTSGVVTVVAHFDGPEIGSQPYEGFTQVGDAWYFTTFTGGETFATSGLSLGAGTLGRLTFDEQGEPVITRLLSLQGGYTQFPAQNPVLVGNSLYFTTVGPNTQPGSIMRYDLDTGFATNVFLFDTNEYDPVLYGKQPGYNGLTEWNGSLYFVTRQGGTANNGVVAKFDLKSNTLTKLADLEGTGEHSLGAGTIGYNVGCVVEEDGRFYMYFPISRGGAHGKGTIIRIHLPPPPINAQLAAGDAGNLQLTWTGGYAPFTVEATSDLSTATWTAIASGISERSVSVPMTGGNAFFRIISSE